MTQLDDLLAQPAFALIRVRDADTVTLVGGPRVDLETLSDIPLVSASDGGWDHLVLVPYAQVRERGFEAHQDGTPLTSIEAAYSAEVPIAELLGQLPDTPIEFTDRGGFETSDDDYAGIVRTIIDGEIGQGEGANLVIGRHFRAQVADWGHDRALTVFRRLLERERGAFWTFLIFTGDRYLIGASPERHVSVEDGQVLGPYLKPMTHLVHTEYLLAGRSSRDVREILRDTMYAATVTGSPVENACRLIKKYETEGREYYASALALIGRDPSGEATVDSPIIIRTADVRVDGRLKVTAGATLVRDSDPAYEVAETHAKAGGILSAFGLVPSAPGAPEGSIASLAQDEDVLLALGSRNQRLSKFWLTDQGGSAPDVALRGKRVAILDGEDDFVNMIRHVFSVMGMTSDVVQHEDYAAGVLAPYDLVIVGPGPGDPRDGDHPKIAAFRAATDELIASGQPFLSICLGHQTLCERLGIELGYKDIVFQGTQSPIPFNGRTERVGFYNTFVGRVGLDGSGLPDGVTADFDPETGDIHVVRGATYRGIQFHAESILTEHGFDIIHDLVCELVLP
jgi:phenazine biosynthesis protein phzE